MKKVYVIKDLGDNTYLTDEKYVDKYGVFTDRILYAKQFPSYADAEKKVIDQSTIIEVFLNNL